MAIIELSISSDDLYWKVMIICVILSNMFLCEHFISNAQVKIIVTILNTVLLANLVLIMATDAHNDNSAMAKLKSINKITTEDIQREVDEDLFIVPVLDNQEVSDDISFCRTGDYRTTSSQHTRYSNNKIPVVYDLTDGNARDILEISYEVAFREHRRAIMKMT